eukprot:62809_1
MAQLSVDDLVANNENLQIAIKQNFPNVYQLMRYNAKGTIALLKANNIIKAYKMTKQFEISHTGSDAHKSWQDYKKAILDYLKYVNSDVRLEKAREKLTERIHTEHYLKFPVWPSVGSRQSANVNVTEKGGYEYQQGVQKEYVAWACEGDVTVTDIRNSESSYYAEFKGKPTLKIIYVDLIKLKQIEALCLNKMDLAKAKADEKTNMALTWDDLI